MARGRPVSITPTREFHIHLRLRVGEDDDLIAFLGSLPRRQLAMSLKAALRAGGANLKQLDSDSSDDELFAAVDDFLK